jgi:hemerythrin superfamily protein
VVPRDVRSVEAQGNYRLTLGISKERLGPWGGPGPFSNQEESPMAKADTQTDAIALLKADHRKVEQLFEKFESARGTEQKARLAEQICMELTVHTIIEEEIFYPACKEKIDDDDLVEESFVEHDGAKVLIAEIEAGSPDEEFYDAKVTVLSEMIKHHVKEEEKRSEGLFAKARDADLDMDELGGRIKARKEQLTQQFKSEGLPPPSMRTMTAISIGR